MSSSYEDQLTALKTVSTDVHGEHDLLPHNHATVSLVKSGYLLWCNPEKTRVVTTLKGKKYIKKLAAAGRMDVGVTIAGGVAVGIPNTAFEEVDQPMPGA